MSDAAGRIIGNYFAGAGAEPLRYIASGTEEMRLLERYENVSRKRLPRDARGGWSVSPDFWSKVLAEARRAMTDWKEVGMAARGFGATQSSSSL
jgi:hypothetical protein